MVPTKGAPGTVNLTNQESGATGTPLYFQDSDIILLLRAMEDNHTRGLTVAINPASQQGLFYALFAIK